MECSLNFEQLPFKSEHLLTNSKNTHVHDNGELYFISWDDCDTLVYPLNIETNTSQFEPTECTVRRIYLYMHSLNKIDCFEFLSVSMFSVNY